MKVLTVASPLLLLATGCLPTDDFARSFAEIESLEVDVRKFEYGDGVTHVMVEVFGDHDCVALDGDFTATLDGATIERRFPAREDAELCGHPYVDLVFPAGAEVGQRLRVGDESRTIEIDLGDRLQPRTASLDLPAGTLEADRDVAITWSHAGDLQQGRFGIDLPALTLRVENGALVGRVGPDAARATGDFEVSMLPSEDRRGVPVACEGATCRAWIPWTARIALSTAPN